MSITNHLHQQASPYLYEYFYSGSIEHAVQSKMLPDEAATLYYHDGCLVRQNDNPTCGFVAAAMAASIRGRQPNVNEMIEWAYSQQLTKIGDLFDIRNMKAICDRYVQVSSTVIDYPDEDAMFSDLLQGRCFLVPYDAGDGGDPGISNGHHAHWVLVLGALLIRTNDDRTSIAGQKSLPFFKPIFRAKFNDYNPDLQYHKRLLFVRQGGTKTPQMWRFDELRSSCMQLNEPDPTLELNYLIPEGGLTNALRGKVLRLDMVRKSWQNDD